MRGCKVWGVLALGCVAASAGAANGGGPIASGVFERAMMGSHNAARRDAGVPDLAWDAGLAADARDWADHLAETGRFEHSTARKSEGENLFMGSAGSYSYEEMVRFWVEEGRNFTDGVFPAISINGQWSSVGHYSQIVWRDTTRVGCALATGDGHDYLVCRYSPPGNVWGRKVF
ncbi:CAP family protein [Sphingomonas sp.]|jgi:hypothetical protein|uniref:CAP family protein n=1 Tax=Sphingomonas sp. TaxID=28214 RepID=UPI002E32CFB9|nr:CAP family protein [Sphingomonas sp.]HEX4693326.1 CAP family protein [Sphingomonas sp.]